MGREWVEKVVEMLRRIYFSMFFLNVVETGREVGRILEDSEWEIFF